MHLRDHSSYTFLADTITRLSQETSFHFYPNPGNWGDSLINAGTDAFFKENLFEYESLSRTQLDRTNKEKLPRLAVVGGGGGWCRNWSSTSRFVQEVSQTYEQVVILPTTFDPQIQLPAYDNVIPFSRDNNPSSSMAHCPDMAFYYNFESSAPTLTYPLLALRRDKERHVESITPYRNFDLSLLGMAEDSPAPLVQTVGHFRTVYTDRLHIAITATMLDREVKLLEGNYPKNRGVYEATLKGRFPKVELLPWKKMRTLDVPGVWQNS